MTTAAYNNLSSLFTDTSSSLLSTLSQASAAAAASLQQQRLNLIDSQLQKQLTEKIAALQPAADPAITGMTEAQTNYLTGQQTTMTNYQSQFTQNATVLSSIQTQLAAMQTAAQNGSASAFDSALGSANAAVQSLTVATPLGIFQPDGIEGLQGAGLGIGDSSSYNLSTPAGQSAAEAAVTQAQNTIAQVFTLTNNNSDVAGSELAAYTIQLGALNTTTTAEAQAQQTQIATETASLTQREEDQENLIALSLGSTQSLANVLDVLTTPQPTTSMFNTLASAVGNTSTSQTLLQQQSPILSLLA